MLARTFADLSAGVPLSVVTPWGITPRSWRRYRATGSAPPWVADKLAAWRYGEPIAAPGWQGFVFREGLLWTPEDQALRVGDVRALPYLMALNRTLQGKLREPQQWKLF